MQNGYLPTVWFWFPPIIWQIKYVKDNMKNCQPCFWRHFAPNFTPYQVFDNILYKFQTWKSFWFFSGDSTFRESLVLWSNMHKTLFCEAITLHVKLQKYISIDSIAKLRLKNSEIKYCRIFVYEIKVYSFQPPIFVLVAHSRTEQI